MILLNRSIHDKLRWAAYNGHLEVVKYLHTHGANINCDNYFALRFAASNGHLEVVKYLHTNGADIHADHYWSLRLAASNGHLEVVKYLQSFSLYHRFKKYICKIFNKCYNIIRY